MADKESQLILESPALSAVEQPRYLYDDGKTGFISTIVEISYADDKHSPAWWGLVPDHQRNHTDHNSKDSSGR